MEEADRSGSDDEEGGERHAELSERLRNDAMEVCFHAVAAVLPLHFAHSHLNPRRVMFEFRDLRCPCIHAMHEACMLSITVTIWHPLKP